jgi:hypothetical protein
MEKTVDQAAISENENHARGLPAWVIVAAFAVLLGFLALIAWGLNRAQQPPIQVGDRVPPFTISTFDGKQIKLDDLAGGQFLGFVVQALRAGSRRNGTGVA